MRYHFHFEVVYEYRWALAQGLLITFAVVLWSQLISWVAGFAISVSRLSKLPILARVSGAYVEFFRGTPELVQIFWIYYCLPLVFGLRLSSVTSGIVALSLFGSAYVGEIFRAGIQAVPRGQVDAARSLGMSAALTMRRIVMPQAVRIVLPPLVSNFADTLKVSALVSTIIVPELMYQATYLNSLTFRPMEFYTTVGLTYFAIVYPVSLLVRRLERKLAART